MTGYICFYSHPDFSKKKKREEKKASIQITYARWTQAFKNALSFSQSSNLETVEQVQVTILFLSTAQFFTYTLVVLTVVLLSRFQMNPQKLIYLKLNIHKKQEASRCSEPCRRDGLVGVFTGYLAYLGLQRVGHDWATINFHFCLFQNSSAKGSSSAPHSHITYQSQSSKHTHTQNKPSFKATSVQNFNELNSIYCQTNNSSDLTQSLENRQYQHPI